MLIKKNIKMADVIHINYLFLRVLDRFGIKLGFGDKKIDEICKEYNVDVDFFLEVINSFNNKTYLPKCNAINFPTQQAINYLRNTHRFFLKIKVVEIENMIKDMNILCEFDKQNILLLNNFFAEYREELKTHIEREEKFIYPYILKISQAYNHKHISDELYQQIKKHSINDYAGEHDNVEEKLFDLKNIIIKYLPPVKNSLLCQKILIELFNLEKDLNDHALLEDKLVVPIIAEKERFLKKLYNAKHSSK